MARLYTCCRGIAKLIRQPLVHLSQQHSNQTLYNVNTSIRASGLSRLVGLQCITSHRSIHTTASINNRSIFEDESDFSTTRYGERGNKRQRSFTDTNQSGYYDEDDRFSRDTIGRQGRDREYSNRRGHQDEGYQNRHGFFNDEYESRGRRQDFNYDDFNAGESPDGVIDSSNLPEIKKNFFKPTEQLSVRTENDNSKFLRDHNITVKGENIPPPIQQFSDYDFPPRFLDKMSQFEKPTAIQAQGWSVALSGEDFIGVGQTGSGKTLGYLLPGLINLAHHQQAFQKAGADRKDAPLGLVLAPTRELVQQIIKVAEQFGPSVGVQSVAMFGGAAKGAQLGHLRRRNAKLIIATPGRLLDCIRSGDLSFGHCGFVVLDEADRMLDMGFEPQIRNIIKYTRSDRQTLMWSATWPEDVRELAGDFLKSPVQLTVGSTELRANPDIQQHVHICDYKEKMGMLGDLLKQMKDGDENAQAIVFCETKRTVDRVTYGLERSNISADAIHGDKSQRQRDHVLNAFRRGRLSVLVATDVAARGIDIPELNCVVNYDYPNDSESYVHRIGRTGRCGNKGTAHAFFTDSDSGQARGLVKLLKQAGQTVSSELEEMAQRGGGGGGRKRGYGGQRGGGGGYSRGGGFGRGQGGGGRGGGRYDQGW